MLDFQLALKFVGAAYLMVCGVAMQGLVIAYMNILVKEGMISTNVSDGVKVLNLFLFFVMASSVAGAVFGYAKVRGMYDGLYSALYAAFGVIFFTLCLYVLSKLAKHEKNLSDRCK